MSTLTFEAFWAWLQLHSNCVVRVAAPNAVLYDDDDLHWYVGPNGEELVLQLIRGKRLVGELLIDSDRVTYVQVLGEEREGEHLFEAILETPSERLASYSFVLAHGLDDEPDAETHNLAVH